MMRGSMEVSRRDFLKTGAFAGSSLLIAFYIPSNATVAEGESVVPFTPNAWLQIDSDGKARIVVAKSEMGQGVLTSLPMLVAEELDIDWSNVSVEQAQSDPLKYGNQETGESSSIHDSWDPLRKAGATAREMLITAAAKMWKVKRIDCYAESGAVIHGPTRRKLSYGELVSTAAKLPVPQNVRLKDPKDFRILGTRIPRLDTPQKVDGTAVFGIDVKIPGMLYASIARPPVFGARLARYDASRAKAIQGVRHIVQTGSGIAAVGDTTWIAMKGREALDITWDEGVNANVGSSEIRKAYHELIKQPGSVARSVGNPMGAFEQLPKKLEALYELPYEAHAAMEPMNCTADVRRDSCEIWAPTQAPELAHIAAVKITGLPFSAIRVHVTLMGGGFGRRLQEDDAIEAVQISREIGAPVKVVWNREDDFQHDFYRPNSLHRLTAGLDAQGNPIVWTHRIVAPSILSYLYTRDIENGMDETITEGALSLPYGIPNIHVDWVSANHIAPFIPLGWWRSVYNSQTAFAEECFIDEMAVAAGKDPYQFRLQLLAGSPRHKGVLELAAGKAGWETPLPDGRYRGIAVYYSFRSWIAQVAEVSVDQEGNVHVHRVVCAIDCGMTVNPSIIEAQMESSIVFGLTAALKGEITFEKGQAVQTNFHVYDILRIGEMPVVETYIVPSKEPPGGVGEPGVPVIAPAIANAVFAATGKRIRQLPIVAQDLTQ